MTDTGTDTGQAWKGGEKGTILNPTVIKFKGKHCNRDFPSSLQYPVGELDEILHEAHLSAPGCQPSMQLQPMANYLRLWPNHPC